MKVARLVLKIVALSLSVAALTCAVVAYWNELVELVDYTKSKLQRRTYVSEYDDYEEKQNPPVIRRFFHGRASSGRQYPYTGAEERRTEAYPPPGRPKRPRWQDLGSG